MRGPASRPWRPFTWRGYLGALGVAAMAQFVVAVVIDAVLRRFGIALHPWQDAAWSVLVGGVFSFFIAPVFWRMGLVTLPQYMIGAFAVMAPIAALSFVILYSADRALIDAPWLPHDGATQAIALTAYVRLLRAAILVPVWLAAFYWAFHIRLRMLPLPRVGTE